MNILATLRDRFHSALSSLVEPTDELLDMIRPAQDARFGDYQANCAMPLGKRLQRPPREIADQIVANLDVDDVCEVPEVAGPGFINLTIRSSWLVEQLASASQCPRLSIAAVQNSRTYVIDYSSPNVAKQMHVGHIRSTVIGDALYRSLRFMGHHVVSDNHLGDWGTQFGMIIYGYRHFADQEQYQRQPIQELGRIYKLVQQLVEHKVACVQIHERTDATRALEETLKQCEDQRKQGPKDKKLEQELRVLRSQLEEAKARCDDLQTKIETVEQNATLKKLAQEHSNINRDVLEETAKLHAGDPDNLALWHQFLPQCKADMQRIYDRLDIQFDVELGESFYHDRLEVVVNDFKQRGLARESDGAECIFMPDFEAPMIIRKKDGAFLYATTDLATIQYRMETWDPDAILYVVDHRQSDHFGKLFAAVRLWGYDKVDLQHISFGTVLGEDGRPYRTRSGEVVGLEGLLDESIRRAFSVVASNDDSKPNGPELSEAQRHEIARTVGHAALKYADLSHNRTSDYVFSYDKMVALEGNTATYMQYSYARTQSIFAKGNVDVDALRQANPTLSLIEPAERDLAMELVRFGDALDKMLDDYRPNILTSYLFSLATRFSRFYQQCDVLRAESPLVRNQRLLLCDLTGRTIRQGLALLGIGVIDKM